MSDTTEPSGLILVVPGIEPEQVEHALSAALAVFEAADVAPDRAARAAWDCHLAGLLSGSAEPRLSDATRRAANVWLEARRSALDLCGRDARGDAQTFPGLELRIVEAPAASVRPPAKVQRRGTSGRD